MSLPTLRRVQRRSRPVPKTLNNLGSLVGHGREALAIGRIGEISEFRRRESKSLR
jgi:hypothetical protein